MAFFAQMLNLPSNKHVYTSQAATISGWMWLQATPLCEYLSRLCTHEIAAAKPKYLKFVNEGSALYFKQ